MVGRAKTIAWKSCTKTLGMENTLQLVRWSSCAYNHYMTICDKSERLSATEGMRVHRQIVDPADPAYHPLAAMLDDRLWATLPDYLRMWIRGKVPFNE